MNKSINLYPTPPAEWLWCEHAEDVKREFHPSVTIPSTDEPLWHECTTADKSAYEAQWALDHPEESPEHDSEEGAAADTAEVPTETKEEDEL